MPIEPDVAVFSGPTRYARAEASPRVRLGLVLAWATVLVVVVELPLWFAAQGIGEPMALVNHHIVFGTGGSFVPRGQPVASFVRARELAEVYASLGASRGARVLALALLGGLSGAALQLVLSRLGGCLRRRREQLALFAWLIGGLLLCRVCLLWVPLAATWIPVGAVLIPVALQLGRRVTLACGLALALGVSAMVAPFDAVLCMVVTAQATALALLTPRRRRAGWRWAAPFVLGNAATALIAYLAAQLLLRGALEPMDLTSLEWGRSSWALIGGLCWPIVGLAIEPLFERAVGNVSRSALIELSDLNHPALQRISTRAPGTWAHSRAMANLAESAAHAVGADALLVRVGAYYHDLGKADEPQHFIENLARGQASPHDELTPERSAAKIIHHVRSSVERGRAAGLPEPIIDFMHTHHGSSRVEFFYQRARQRAAEAGGESDHVDASIFAYPGVRPQSPETGILMIVDSVEAASRTLAQPQRRELDNLLRQIVFTKLADGQLDDCGLTLRDLRRVIETLVDALLASAHDRITYPWQEEEAERERASSTASLRVIAESETSEA